MNHLQDFHPRSFDIADQENDYQYYTSRTIPPLMDQGGYKAIEALYHTLIQKSDTIVDLMCGSDSHLPNDIEYQHLIGIDLNEKALHENTRLTKKIIQDLYKNPQIPLQDNTADYICLCCVVEYLRNPIEIFSECYRILKPSGRIIISFSSHFLPLRATALWQALSNQDRQKLIKVFLQRTGFIHFDQGEVHPPADHPVWKDSIYSVIAQK
ncbi:class I SAM-dependent methyltransferase [Commensalibacter oyaizuii]|uniref:Class I SAM-dependent methyltransferase n=1 Tax=Commensalibacter oyaizuii TaxID=3043873 RepID=A0ABT6Q1B4_9PROT|nr:class I SAM-dependent methyltransferase [Commensalibacter sp. TBRC 16381]MDI2090906.1 class I SAM-dependent methyltransferase [Commensalibacter sp. TBRC 16381]